MHRFYVRGADSGWSESTFFNGLLGGGISQFCGLMSEDISWRQWDRLHYRVFDVEHDAIEFLCDSFDCYDERRSM